LSQNSNYPRLAPLLMLDINPKSCHSIGSF